MKSPVTPRLLEEAATFRLRHTCGDCLYALPRDACLHEWPTAEHRDQPGPDSPTVTFCKEFELR